MTSKGNCDKPFTLAAVKQTDAERNPQINSVIVLEEGANLDSGPSIRLYAYLDLQVRQTFFCSGGGGGGGGG